MRSRLPQATNPDSFDAPCPYSEQTLLGDGKASHLQSNFLGRRIDDVAHVRRFHGGDEETVPNAHAGVGKDPLRLVVQNVTLRLVH